MSHGRPDFSFRRSCVSHGSRNCASIRSNVATVTPVSRRKLALRRRRLAESGWFIGGGSFTTEETYESGAPMVKEAPPRRDPNHQVVTSATGLTWLIHGIAGIRRRVSRKLLIAFTDRMLRSTDTHNRAAPHPPCPTIRPRPFFSQLLAAGKSLRASMVAA